MDSAITVAREPTHVVEWTEERKQLFKDQINSDLTDGELEMFGQLCARKGLDPFDRQIYAIKRRDRRAGREIMTVQVSIDGFRLIAERSGLYAGQVGPQWCGEDGAWRDVWLSEDAPAAARVGVLRKDWTEPLWRVALYRSYCQMKDGTPQYLWATMPEIMLAKCAEAAALRAAFPHDLSGLYTTDEMDQADSDERPPARTQDSRPRPSNQSPKREIAARSSKPERRPSGPSDRMTTNQRGYIEALAREVGLPAAGLTAFTEERFSRPFAELSRSEASELIDALQELKEERARASVVDTTSRPAEASPADDERADEFDQAYKAAKQRLMDCTDSTTLYEARAEITADQLWDDELGALFRERLEAVSSNAKAGAGGR